MIYYEQGFCLTKFGAPFFASPSKTTSIQKVLVQPFLFYSTKCLGGSDWMRSLVPLLKLFAVKNSFEKKLLLLSLAGQLFFGLNFLDGGSTFKHVFPDFRTNRIRKTGCFHPGRILGPRGAQRHLKHEDRSSQSASSPVTLLLF